MFDFHGGPADPGWPEASWPVLDVVRSLLRAMEPRYIVEAGTYLGHSARAMAQVVPDARLDTLDPCERCWGEDRGFDAYPLIVPHLCRAVDFTPHQQIDFLFIDSDIDGRVDDFHHFRPYLSPGAVVVIDDAQLITRRLELGGCIEVAGALILQTTTEVSRVS